MSRSPFRSARIARAAACMALALSGAAAPAHAMDIWVGDSATQGACDVETIQQAFDLARQSAEPVDIRVTRTTPDGEWSGQQLLAEDFDGRLAGGYERCEEGADRAMTVLHGTPDAPVLTLRGHTHAHIENFELHGGGGSGLGASIDYQANGNLRLERIVATGARTSLGAVGFRGVVEASLSLGDDVRIVENGTSGLYVTGHSTIESIGNRTSISDNRFDGIRMINIDDADVTLGDSEISGNGGFGIAWVNPATPLDNAAFARFQSRSPDMPLLISRNSGGAVLLLASAQQRTLCMRNVRIEDHVAEGAGVDFRGSVIRVDGAGAQYTDVNPYCSFRPDTDFACPAGACGALHGNRSSGPLVSVTNGARLVLRHGVITGNRAPVLIAADAGTASPETGIQLINPLVAGNVVDDALIANLGGGHLQITGATIADNAGAFTRSFSAIDSGPLQVYDSIVDQEQDLLHAEGSTVDCCGFYLVLARNATGASPTDTILIGVPRYRPSTYELAENSPGVDFTIPLGGTDLNGHARDVDLPGVPNVHGSRDLGAFESQDAGSIDRVFVDGFDSTSRRSVSIK